MLLCLKLGAESYFQRHAIHGWPARSCARWLLKCGTRVGGRGTDVPSDFRHERCAQVHIAA